MELRRTRLSEIDSTIVKLQLQLKKLERERCAVTKSLTFPVLALPVEITSKIFIECLPDTPREPSPYYAPLLLSSICKKWRNITLSLPRLWSSWAFSVEDDMSMAFRRSLMECWLSRSQNHPLSIRLHHRCGSIPWFDDDFPWARRSADASIEIICKYSRQWKNIEINLPIPTLKVLSQFGPKDDLPLLSHLVLGSAEYDSQAASPITMFKAAHRLQSVHLLFEGGSLISNLPLVSLPWAQLTSFSGTMFSIAECVFVLCQTPALVDCIFHVCITDADDYYATVPLAEPMLQLKSLKLITTEGTEPIGVLRRVTLPGLVTLSLEFIDSPTERFLASFLHRSSCSLLHFSCGFVNPILFRCLRIMPTLSTLEIRDSSHKEIAGLIRELEDDPDAVPYLESLMILCQKYALHDGDFPFGTLLCMLFARVSTEGRPGLRCFKLIWLTSLQPRPPNFEELIGYRYLVQKGIDIYLGSPKCSWI
ncbi:hypothetical protein B0H10DRAFT_2059096 [Mycena sp. CBHHK59/15]|nr:hypothetical protein B0H10DRAFT_2059096 [Mycena sp. CBHHK59/15]